MNELIELQRLRNLVDKCLVSQLVRTELGVKDVGTDRTNSQSQETVVRCSCNSVLPEQSVHRTEQYQNKSEVEALFPGQEARQLRKTCRDGLARKIATLYRVPESTCVRDPLEEGRDSVDGQAMLGL